MKFKLTLLFGAALAATLTCAQGAPAKTTWKSDCAKCHGTEGKGDTRIGHILGVKDYSDPKVQDKLTDDAAFKAIKEGVTVDGKKKMPGFGNKLSDDEIHGLVKYVRGLKKKS